jgi:hypothetical protein
MSSILHFLQSNLITFLFLTPLMVIALIIDRAFTKPLKKEPEIELDESESFYHN